jgi:serine/threonine protein kinase
MSVANSHAPETIGNYVIENALAHGSMGTVYIARHALTYARVALKVIRNEANADKQAEERFLREVRAAAQIGHEGIVKVQDAGKTAEGHLFLAMELLTGETLEDRVAHGTGERLTGMEWIAALLEPLMAAHEHSIVHRDLKPANVFIARAADGTEHIKLLDFGLARDTREKSGTQTGIALGTPYYMSPEQAARPKDVGPASDVWSVGVMMYEILTGHMPFDGETMHAVVIHAATVPHVPCAERAPTLDRDLAALVDRCLSKDPALRPHDAGELRARLLPLLEDESVRAELANAVPRAPGVDGEDADNTEETDQAEPKRMPFADTAIALAHDSRIQDVHPRTKSSGLGMWISTLAVLAFVIAGFFWALERNADKNAAASAPAPSGADDAPPVPDHSSRPAATRDEHSRLPVPAPAPLNLEPASASPAEAQDVQPGSRRDRGRARRGATSANGVALPPSPFEPSDLAAVSGEMPAPETAPPVTAQDPAAAANGDVPAAKAEPAPEQPASNPPAAEQAPPAAAGPAVPAMPVAPAPESTAGAEPAPETTGNP